MTFCDIVSIENKKQMSSPILITEQQKGHKTSSAKYKSGFGIFNGIQIECFLEQNPFSEKLRGDNNGNAGDSTTKKTLFSQWSHKFRLNKLTLDSEKRGKERGFFCIHLKRWLLE